jgi:hypothetical protein
MLIGCVNMGPGCLIGFFDYSNPLRRVLRWCVNIQKVLEVSRRKKITKRQLSGRIVNSIKI